MDLDDQAVLEAHPDHLGEDLPAEELRLRGIEHPREGLSEEPAAGGCVEIGGDGARVAVIGGGGAHLPEEPAARRQGPEIPLPGAGLLPGDLAQADDILPEPLKIGVGHGIGAEAGDNPPAPARRGDRLVVFEGIEGGVRRGERLDVEAIEEGAGPELRTGQGLRNPVVERIRIGRIEPVVDAEEEIKDVFEPHPGRRSPEEVVVLRKQTPDRAGIGFDGSSVDPGNPQFLERDALAVEHPEQVVIRDQEQRRRIGKGDIVGIPPGIGMPVRADDGEPLDLAVQAAGDQPLGRSRWGKDGPRP